MVRRELRGLLRPLVHLTTTPFGELPARAEAIADAVRVYVLAPGDGPAATVDVRREARCRLHDSILQTLEYLANDAYGTGLDADHARSLAGGLIGEAQRLIASVGAPPPPCNLREELERAVRDSGCDTCLEVRMSVTTAVEGLSHERAADLVAATREALNNVRKHAAASVVSVSVDGGAGESRVRICDDGVGLPPEGARAGFGLAESIAARLARRGGAVALGASPEGGASVMLRMPHAP